LYAFDKAFVSPVANAVVKRAAPKTSNQSFRKQDNQPPGGVKFDGLVAAESLSGLIDQPIVLKLRSGLLVSDAKVESLQFDRRGNGLRILKYQLSTGRSVPIKSPEIFAMRIGAGRYHLRYYPK
jgi:hypothetical protein